MEKLKIKDPNMEYWTFCIFSIISMIAGQILAEKSHVQPSRIFILEKYRLSPSIQGSSTTNLEVYFFTPYKNRSISKFFVSDYPFLRQRNSPYTQWPKFIPSQKQGLFWVYLGFLWHSTEQRQIKYIEC